MKKVIAALFILVNILLFFNIREVYMEKDLADVHQIQKIHPDIVHASIIIDNLNNEQISVEESNAIFTVFKDLTQRFDLMILAGEFYITDNIYIHYLISNTPADRLLGLVTDISLNFHEHTDYFYTNKKNVENGVNFFLLNNRIDVRILPITAMGTIMGGEYTFVALSQNELDESISIFMDEFGSYVDRVIEFGSEPYDVDEAVDSFLSPLVFAAMLLLFLIIIIYIHHNSKKIAIMKTMGTSIFAIAKHLLLPLLLLLTLIFASINVTLFFLFIGEINIRTVPIIRTLAQSGGLQLTGVVVTMAVSCLLLLIIPAYSLLKNSSYNRYLMGANTVLKIVMIVTIMPLLSGRIDSIQDDFRMLNYTRHYEQNSSIANYQFAPMHSPRYRKDGHFSFLMNLAISDDWDNIGPDDIYEHEILYLYHHAYRVLNEAGAIYCEGSMMFDETPLLIVNENYLAKHPIHDTSGNTVDLSNIGFSEVFLVPEIYMSQGFSSMFSEYGYGFIEVNNEQSLYDYSLNWRSNGIPSQPYLVFVRMDSLFVVEASPLRNVFINGDINETLRDTYFHNKILVSTVGDELNLIREWHMSRIIEHLMVMIPSFALLLVIVIQFSYLYLKVFKKRIYAKKIMGHNQFRIYSQLLLESCLAVVAAFSISLYLQLDLRLFIGVLVLEVIVYLVVVAISLWKHSIVYDYCD